MERRGRGIDISFAFREELRREGGNDGRKKRRGKKIKITGHKERSCKEARGERKTTQTKRRNDGKKMYFMKHKALIKARISLFSAMVDVTC